MKCASDVRSSKGYYSRIAAPILLDVMWSDRTSMSAAAVMIYYADTRGHCTHPQSRKSIVDQPSWDSHTVSQQISRKVVLSSSTWSTATKEQNTIYAIQILRSSSTQDRNSFHEGLRVQLPWYRKLISCTSWMAAVTSAPKTQKQTFRGFPVCCVLVFLFWIRFLVPDGLLISSPFSFLLYSNSCFMFHAWRPLDFRADWVSGFYALVPSNLICE